MGQKMIY